MPPPHQNPGLNPDSSYNSVPRPRPRFELSSEASPAGILDHFRKALGATSEIKGLVVDENGTVELTLAEARVRVWSPQLSLLISENGTGSRITARFGPHPHVWGMFLAGYAISGMLACCCALFGIVQLFLDQTPWALYATPIAVLGAALVYGAAYVGQGLGAGQMHDLRAFVDLALSGLESEA